MESKYVEHSYKSVERNSHPLELIYTDICDMKLTPSHGGKSICYFIENRIINDYVYLINGKNEAIEMSRQCNITSDNQCEKI